ncbi:hypothetical protein Dtox_3836 [Desulfofarcimen acetoxidans DSM 771]|uniref:Uncharacterized protein n=1 Tax=Desulfofarcimen acetoxidans (strain ATCC 49208 / DSM 771 / KCTC 5769 / VKM B-1644 / 5575) TaxID=485916 RepID=C8VXE4_DESAS|nr:hypothetical protein [Desulfofarcimen acetoxidans]ACV64540.1 hypothetical protein Dtox_3836 [Desulfofarcimen acetoxidans DSM 771]
MNNISSESVVESKIAAGNTCIGEEEFPGTRIEAAQLGMKTVVLWIYNINQNGSSNLFQEDMSRHFTSDKDGNVIIRDMSPELMAQFLSNLTTSKEIQIHELGIRLMLFVYNCNQNGSNNAARVTPVAE